MPHKVKKWTGKETITLNEAISFLNEILDLNPNLIQKLINDRFPCNQSICDHPTIQVHAPISTKGQQPRVGLLGILNGLFGIDQNHFGGITACGDIDKIKKKFNVKKFHLTNTVLAKEV